MTSAHWMATAALVVGMRAAVAAEPDGQTAWQTHCSQNLAARHLAEPAVRTYCSCMAGLGDDVEMLGFDQKQLEKSYPYAHVRCVDRAAKTMQSSTSQ